MSYHGLQDQCKICNTWGSMYDKFPNCRICHLVVCLKCIEAGSIDTDYDHYNCICSNCETDIRDLQTAEFA